MGQRRVFMHQGTLHVYNSTLAANSALGGEAQPGGDFGAGYGGAVFVPQRHGADPQLDAERKHREHGRGGLYTVSFGRAHQPPT